MNQKATRNEQRYDTKCTQHSVSLIFNGTLFLSLLSFTACVFSSNFDSPAAVTDNSSAMFTVDDIYNRLDVGTDGSKRTTTFTEPTVGPATASHDLNDVMGKAPAVDNSNGAIASEVLNNKTFWGLRSNGTWGTTTGTAHPAPVPQTGQNQCYPGDGITGGTIACAGTGQDGELQKGITPVGPRFIKNVNAIDDDGGAANNGNIVDGTASDGVCNGSETCNGTVTDANSGLIWQTKANCINTDHAGFDNDGNVGDGDVTWQHALDFVAGINAGTYDCSDTSNGGIAQTDWRLPNRFELESLLDLQNISPPLPTNHPFSSVPVVSLYWSSTTLAATEVDAWTVEFVTGSTIISNKSSDSIHFVWPVRGGQ